MDFPNRFTPKSPEEIEPLLVATNEPLLAGSEQLLNHGILSFMNEFNSRSTLVTFGRHDHSRLWRNGASINKFYSLSTLVGPEGELRKGRKPTRIGSYSYSMYGLTMSAQLYNGRFSFSRSIVDLGLLPNDEDRPRPSLTTVLAQGVFELLNNEEPANRVTANTIVTNGINEYADAVKQAKKLRKINY